MLFDDKWGTRVAADGHAQVPHTLVRNQGRLDLSDGEMCTLIALIDAWWGLNQLPFLSTATLAKRRGVSQRTIERQLNSLLKKGLISKASRQGVRDAYVFDGLKAELEKLAAERAGEAPQQIVEAVTAE